MTTTQSPSSAASGEARARRTVKVSGSTIAAARAQVAISKKLGKTVPKAVSKIARVR